VYSDIVTVTVEKRDVDDDGVLDDDDAFPTDPAASKDTDGDGYPDEWNAGKTAVDSTKDLKLDEFPNDPEKWEKDDDDGPGFELLGVVLGVLIVAWWRRKSLREKLLRI